MGKKDRQESSRLSFQKQIELKGEMATKEDLLAKYTSRYEKHKHDREYAEKMLRMANEQIEIATNEEEWHAKMVRRTQKEIDNLTKKGIALDKFRNVIHDINTGMIFHHNALKWNDGALCPVESIRGILGL